MKTIIKFLAVGGLLALIIIAAYPNLTSPKTDAANSTATAGVLVPATIDVPTLNQAAVKSITNKDANIRKVEIEDTQIKLDYQQTTKILGLIPSKFNLHITADPSKKKLTVARPWWTIFSTTPARKILETLRAGMNNSAVTTTTQALQTISKTMRDFNQVKSK